jgi:hypothetical protein
MNIELEEVGLDSNRSNTDINYNRLKFQSTHGEPVWWPSGGLMLARDRQSIIS